MTLTQEDAARMLQHARARLVEVVHVDGELRWNVVLPSGRPQTWRVSP